MQRTGFEGTMNKAIKYYHAVTQTGEDMILESHCHSGYELIYILSGQVAVNLEGRIYELCAGNAIIIPPLMYHSIRSGNTMNYDRIWFEFTGKNIPEEIFGKLADAIDECPVLTQPGQLQPMGSRLDALSAAVYAPLVQSILVQLLYQFVFRAPSTDEQAMQSTDPTVRKIIRYTSEHIGQKITLEELSGITFLSVSNICALFRREMHVSIKQYILQKKMSYAENLMREGNTALFAAQSVGYSNYNNFYTVYTKLMGHAPSHDKPKKESEEDA